MIYNIHLSKSLSFIYIILKTVSTIDCIHTVFALFLIESILSKIDLP
jgi:hypothetical protein